METAEFEGKSYTVFGLDTVYGHEDVICVPLSYMGGELAIVLMSLRQGVPCEEYAVLTVNLDCYTGARTQSGTRAYVDVNNNDHWGCRQFIEKHGLGTPTGQIARSGYCTYPLYEFDTAKFFA